MKYILFLLFLIASSTTFAQQLTYQPKNPNFGGETFNYQWLLSSANAQNSFKDPEENAAKDQSELESFASNLNRQLLSQISRGLFTAQLGEGLEAGTYNFGSLALEIYDSNEGLVINILDTNTGEQTQIIVPNQ
ncbi:MULTISPECIES: curli production assembly/transport component CsgF [Leeuwenhoekiella]|jgi:curli production assembly/transport component CsgF|uniref:Curli production assembly/transport component CsgF n=1 Tax=Leeuwenhoekiella blandensis (strain CECT 7118 / CCUG 51940 / KCTC 22103 / MED217) TaxID=398720 RepID=A3XJK9_LEEBM|nr:MULTISPECIES: curli production assembly/transport component CsgF [Leeuwenhoekiella]EAQ50263.1 Curli production assembly/transport component, CsgF [Leeuwenhoekiella blandensis MED217]MAO43590.1 curli assembly protein CsgF [Leeuwenhoekiella sp.]HBT09648.1 curli assembly protein CsgF [Leeuwenhoekiella sp.]HCW63212.1 curli assembly protein CsgF [Leeuwenhoekiella sp.]|tara:strand:- start:5142 stop:5543 length:402 start_codon:yes stop_codon:yes gene_type:complete